MENLQNITSFFASIWSLFTSINHPLLGIPLSVIYMGVFAIAISVMFLRPILGVGMGAIGDISRTARNKSKSLKSANAARRENRYENSYESYAKKRSREEYFQRRYEREHKL